MEQGLDLQPNIGLQWYFFTEIFRDMRAVFKAVFACLPCLFIIPLALRLPHRPLFLILLQTLSTSLFKPYPAAADVALYLVCTWLSMDNF